MTAALAPAPGYATTKFSEAPAPKINTTPVPRHLARAMKSALKMVDMDIKTHGSLTFETIQHYRAVLVLAAEV